MGFIANIFTAIIDVVVAIVEAVVQVVEMVVQLIMVLLGWDGGSTQVIEYYEVQNIPLFDDVDKKNPTASTILQSILADKDLVSSLIYHLAFRSLKGNVKEFMDFIDNGNYFESFPVIESYILTVDYDEVTDVLDTINGVPCTIENAYLRALSKSDWVKSWLQDNKGYDVGLNRLGHEYREIKTTPSTPASDTVNVTPSLNHFQIDITSEMATSDDVLVDMRWFVNLNTIAYNSGTNDYTVEAYNAAGVTITLPYTVPAKPTQVHYVVTYYRDVNPSRIYLFIYQAGSGVYTALDTIEDPIDIDGSTLEVLPAVPLRISNSNYTTFGATKQAAIEDILKIIHLDAAEVLDAILTDPGVANNLGDIDNIYVNFGVRMWDTTQAGMSYLYRMFENLYPAQAVTQGIYNNSPAGDDKPQNNILTSTDDNEYAFQWSYITYTHTSLATIDSNSGSTENGIYYSDMSKFGDDGLLKYNYYSSSGKGTYNVGYKADTLTEVANFLAGNGTPNPGITSGEAANWLQVTERMSYNNPTPVLQEADGSTASLIYLTPDAVYENNGSGTLRLVQAAAEETTIGQSITYYCIKPSGLDAYTVVAPIGALKVIDGDTSKFKMVKFNLGAQQDLMVPFIHTFIKDLSHAEVSKLFLAGCHVSIYIAHYEVIVQAGMSFLTALVMIVIIVVIVIIALPAIKAGFAAIKAGIAELVSAAMAGTFLSTAWGLFLKAVPTMLIKFAAQYVIQLAIEEIAKDNPELAMILNIVASVAISMWDPGVTFGPTGAPIGTYGHTGGATLGAGGGSLTTPSPSTSWSFRSTGMKFKSLSSLTFLDLAEIATKFVTGIGSLESMAVGALAETLAADSAAWGVERASKLQEINEMENWLDTRKAVNLAPVLTAQWRVGGGRSNNGLPEGISAPVYLAASVGAYVPMRIDSTFMHPWDHDPYDYA